jgi:hypothetical protein
MATDFRQIELDDHQRHLLASAADQTGLPWPEVFEKAIGSLASSSHEVHQNGKSATPFELLSQHGLIGCIEDTPPDLSTNKNYMAGYGKNG